MAASKPLATRFSDWVIPQILSAGCFGPSCEIVKYEVTPERKGEDQFSSSVQFFQLEMCIKEVLSKINIVVKFQPDCALLRKEMEAYKHFKNEIFMYTKMLPFLEKDGIVESVFPKFYHGLSNDGSDDESDYVVIEDLSRKGYRLTKEKVFLDYDHCVLAMKGIGKFHALSYIAKKNKNSEFKELVSRLIEVWDDNRLIKLKEMFLECGQRGILPLINKQHHANLLREYLKNYDDPFKFYSSLVEPTEPEAVICHGDFCRNNMLFSYGDDGKPVSVKFFDLQMPRYASPVVDLSFFLLLNTSKETREKYWDEFINVYTEAVKSVIPDYEVPSLNFKRYGVYGYLHCSFFLPVMLSDSSDIPSMEERATVSSQEIASVLSRIGGNEGTEALVDLTEFVLSKDLFREKYY